MGFEVFDLEAMPWELPLRRKHHGTNPELLRQKYPVHEKWLLPPTDGRMVASIIRFGPNMTYPRHMHTQPELTIFLRGSGVFDGHEVGPGFAAYVDANTVYGPEAAGPDGCEFLIVRPRLSESIIVDE